MTVAPEIPRALVTGGAGVIGTELVERLLSRGAAVLVCDRKPRPERLTERVEYIEGDANELGPEHLAPFAPTHSFHLAAAFERSTESPEFWWENAQHNVRLSTHMGDLYHHLPTLRRVVFASSYLVYDPARYLFAYPSDNASGLAEDAPLRPRNICGAAKLLHEHELRFLAEVPGMPFSTASARIYRVYGRGSQDVIGRWVRALVADPAAKLELFAAEGSFDYIFAGDVAEGLLRVALTDVEGPVNLGTGRARRVADIVAVLRDRFPEARFVERDTDIAYEAHRADIERLVAATGWTPPTTLEEGIVLLIDHERARRHDRSAQGPVGVLITSAARKVPLVRRAQRLVHAIDPDALVVAGDVDDEAATARIADRFWRMPRLDQLTVDDVVAQCKELAIRVIVPTRDGELEAFARWRPELERGGVWVLGSDAGPTATCLDKLSFSEALDAAGLPGVQTVLDPGELPDTTRFVVKERHGAGSRTIGLDLDAGRARQHAALLGEPVFQPFLSGKELSVDVYRSRAGEVIEAVPRRRTRVHAGESVVTETVEHPAAVGLAVNAAEALDIHGHAVLQVIDCREGLRVIECNPRVGGASEAAFAAGLDTLRWALDEALGRRVGPKLGKYRRGLKLVRYPADMLVQR